MTRHRPRPEPGRPVRTLVATAVALSLVATGASAQDASPAPEAVAPEAVEEVAAVDPSGPGWPSPDALRRELQAIGFAFRIDRESGEWLGWPPRSTPLDAHAITLASDVTAPTWARATFETLETDLLGGDVDGALTALLEAASRTPLPPSAVARAFRFIVDDLLVEVPVLQADCYATTTSGGIIVIRLDTETGAASVLLAEAGTDHPDAASIEDCSAIGPRVAEREAAEGDATIRDERVTIAATAAGFEPAEVELEGPSVTVVLTFRNDDANVRELAFDAPVGTTSGPVEPGASALVIVRRLPTGTHAFRDAGARTDAAGRIIVTDPLLEDEASPAP